MQSPAPAKSFITVASILFLILSGIAPLLLHPTTTLASHSQCSDGIDNDGNGRIDFPQDLACDSLDDPFEGVGSSAVFATITDGRDDIRAGDSMIYIISLIQQREELKDVSVELHVPAEIDLVSADRGGMISGSNIHWDHIALQNNVQLKLTVQARVRTTARPDALIVARVSTEGTVATDTTSVLTTDVGPYRPIYRVSLSDGRDFIASQANLVYVLEVENLTDDERSTTVQVFIPDNVALVDIPDGARYDGHKLTWEHVGFRGLEHREFVFDVRIPERLRNYRPIYVRARVGSQSASDSTVILTGFPAQGLRVTIDSDHTETRHGDVIVYRIVVSNNTSIPTTMAAVNATLPLYGEFVSVTEGGVWDGNVIRWRHLQIAPNNDDRILSFSARVRSDAPLEQRLIATVDADGDRDDTSTIVSGRSVRTSGNRSSRRSTYIRPVQTPPLSTLYPSLLSSTPTGGYVPEDSGKNLLLRKSAQQSEVMPGGRIRYTITVRNVLLHRVRDAVVTDQFDPLHLTVVDSGGATSVRDGILTWNIPTLAPGQTWKTSYVLAVDKNAPNRFTISNIARITGADVRDAAFGERVTVTQTGVLTHLPSTGAPLDTFLALLLVPAALACALMHRRSIV